MAAHPWDFSVTRLLFDSSRVREVRDRKWGSCRNMSLLEAYIHLAVLIEMNL